MPSLHNSQEDAGNKFSILPIFLSRRFQNDMFINPAREQITRQIHSGTETALEDIVD